MDTIKGEISHFQQAFDFQEIIKRIVKYLIEGASFAVVAFYVPRKVLAWEEIVLIALTAAATFAILDMYAPSISSSARQGTGFGIGANLVGFPKL